MRRASSCCLRGASTFVCASRCQPSRSAIWRPRVVGAAEVPGPDRLFSSSLIGCSPHFHWTSFCSWPGHRLTQTDHGGEGLCSSQVLEKRDSEVRAEPESTAQDNARQGVDGVAVATVTVLV